MHWKVRCHDSQSRAPVSFNFGLGKGVPLSGRSGLYLAVGVDILTPVGVLPAAAVGSSAIQAVSCQADLHAALQICPQSAGFTSGLWQAMLPVAGMTGQLYTQPSTAAWKVFPSSAALVT